MLLDLRQQLGEARQVVAGIGFGARDRAETVHQAVFPDSDALCCTSPMTDEIALLRAELAREKATVTALALIVAELVGRLDAASGPKGRLISSLRDGCVELAEKTGAASSASEVQVSSDRIQQAVRQILGLVG